MHDNICVCDIVSADIIHISFSFPECNRYWIILFMSSIFLGKVCCFMQPAASSRPTSKNKAHNQTFYFHFFSFCQSWLAGFALKCFVVFSQCIWDLVSFRKLYTEPESWQTLHTLTPLRGEMYRLTPERKHYRSVSTKWKHKTSHKWVDSYHTVSYRMI